MHSKYAERLAKLTLKLEQMVLNPTPTLTEKILIIALVGEMRILANLILDESN